MRNGDGSVIFFAQFLVDLLRSDNSTPLGAQDVDIQALAFADFNETVAKVDVVTAQSSQTPSSTAQPVTADTPATGDFPVLYLAGIVGLILICSAGLLMLRKI